MFIQSGRTFSVFITLIMDSGLFILFFLPSYVICQRSLGNRGTSEVVVPLIYHDGHHLTSTKTQNTYGENVTVVIKLRHRQLVLELQQKRHLIPKTFTVRSFTKDGFPVDEQPYRQGASHCHFEGQVRGHSDSLVSVSTCSGLSGTISSDEHYLIRPLENRIQGKHEVYQTQYWRNHHDNLFSGYTNHQKTFTQSRGKRSLRYQGHEKQPRRLLELFVVADQSVFKRLKRNKEDVKLRVQEIVHQVDTIWSQVGVRVALVGLDIWDRQDEMQISWDSIETAEHFTNYRLQKINNRRQNDHAQLLTGKRLSGSVNGATRWEKGMCTHQYSAGVTVDETVETIHVASSMAREIAHSFGVPDRSVYDCNCYHKPCVMRRRNRYHSEDYPVQWSDCARKALAEVFEKSQDYCLHNLPTKLPFQPFCGNNFLEKDEECDCGSPEMCKNKCCNPETCKFTTNATCATGSCCDLSTCQVKPRGTECRTKNGQCDLAEGCNGKSEFCPADVFLYNGHPCSDGQKPAYCYKGKCKTLDSQCRDLWGRTAHHVPSCSTHLNYRGDGSGNCGFDPVEGTYVECSRQDSLCGMVWCDHSPAIYRNATLQIMDPSLAYVIPTLRDRPTFKAKFCKGIIMDVGLSTPDPGLASDGIRCGEQKMCFQQKCQNITELGFGSTCGKCSGNGVCNSNGNCHCNKGFAPPNCDKPGHGGSIDSGLYSEDSKGGSNKAAILAGVLVPILLILAVLAAIFLYKYREKFTDQIRQVLQKRDRSHSRPPVIPSSGTGKQDSPANQSKIGSNISRTPNFVISGPKLEDTTCTVAGGSAASQGLSLGMKNNASADPYEAYLQMSDENAKKFLCIMSPSPAWSTIDLQSVDSKTSLVGAENVPASQPVSDKLSRKFLNVPKLSCSSSADDIRIDEPVTMTGEERSASEEILRKVPITPQPTPADSTDEIPHVECVNQEPRFPPRPQLPPAKTLSDKLGRKVNTAGSPAPAKSENNISVGVHNGAKGNVKLQLPAFKGARPKLPGSNPHV